MSTATTHSPETQALLTKLETLHGAQLEQTKRLDALENKAADARRGSGLYGAPHARRGEDPMGSRGYSFQKLFGVLTNTLDASEAKVEIELSNRLQKALVETQGYTKAHPNSILAPMASAFLSSQTGDRQLAADCHDLVKGGVSGCDPDEVREIRQMLGGGVRQKTLSWQDLTQGGALVGPPIFGELIDVLRNNECLMAAGCRVIPMPPTGRVVYPKQTAAATAYFVGESTQITSSQPSTGDLVLSAKKLGVLLKVPNELFRFASVAVEQFLREDIARVMALRLDKELLEGVGSGVSPKGLINYANISKISAGVTGANGDTFQPEDILKTIGTVEEQNAVFKSWLMRPLMYAALANRRADAVTPGDGKGMFLFDVLRDKGMDMDVMRGMSGMLSGYPVLKSTQIANNRAKGSSTSLSYILGGDFHDYILALSGVMEFLVSTQGDTPFQQDQTWIRGISFVDGGPRHEASFVLVDNLNIA